MRLTSEEVTIARTMLEANGKKIKIKSHLTNLRLKKEILAPISLRAIHNVDTNMRLQKETLLEGETELQKLLNSMSKVPGAKVRVVRDENNSLKAIYFQDKRMLQLFDKYPQVICYDATYRMNNRNMPVFIQTIIDGNGQTEIVSIWICESESTIVAETMLETFKEFNPNWVKIQCIIGDKDFADREVYAEKFPNAALQICLFHVLQTFNREITTSKRQITQVQRQQVLELLQKLCYARSEEYYNEQYENLCILGFDKVMEYFDTNWHVIRNQWTTYGRNKFSNYFNHTNNRNESLNHKLKMINTRNANLLSFFENMSTSIAVLSSEKDIKAIRSTMKTSRTRFDDETLKNYQTLLTAFSFQKIADEYMKTDKVEFVSCDDNLGITNRGIEVSSEHCSCDFFNVMGLPCRHIFTFYRKNDKDTFLPDLCIQRWTKRYYSSSHPALNTTDSVTPPVPIFLQTVRTPDEKSKYKKVANITKRLNSLLSTLPLDKYNHFLNQLNSFEKSVIESDSPQHGDDEANEDMFNQMDQREQVALLDQPLPIVAQVGNIHGQGNQTLVETCESNAPQASLFPTEAHFLTNVNPVVQEDVSERTSTAIHSFTNNNKLPWSFTSCPPYFCHNQMLCGNTSQTPLSNIQVPQTICSESLSESATSQLLNSQQWNLIPCTTTGSYLSGLNASTNNNFQTNSCPLEVITATKAALKSTILPKKHNSIGRPKGRLNTVVGTKRKLQNTTDNLPHRKEPKVQLFQVHFLNV